MIGRTEKLRPLDTITWAREMARPQAKRRPPYNLDDRAPAGLKRLEAHVLLILASFANEDGKAWPSLQTLAECTGYKVSTPQPKRDKTGKVTSRGVRCSAISAALDSLVRQHQLIWTEQAGRGRCAVRELLLNPPAYTGGKQADATPSADALPPVDTGGSHPSGRVGKYQEKRPDTATAKELQGSDNATRQDGWRSHPSDERADNDDDEAERLRFLAALPPDLAEAHTERAAA